MPGTVTGKTGCLFFWGGGVRARERGVKGAQRGIEIWYARKCCQEIMCWMPFEKTAKVIVDTAECLNEEMAVETP